MSELIDTTEMYLRTIFELIEEEIPPLRARIAERLHQSGPTVSQTVARMERDGLLVVDERRIIQLSPRGLELARAVMRKHRLAERLLTDVIGLEWEKAHEEACRWEHVISEDVERRLLELLDSPEYSPYGNPIPGLTDLGADVAAVRFREGTQPLATLLQPGVQVKCRLGRMSETLQADTDTLACLGELGLAPQVEFVARIVGHGLELRGPEGRAVVDPLVAERLYVVSEQE